MRLDRRTVLKGVAVAASCPAEAALAADSPIYRDPEAPTQARVHDLLGRMTLEEKAAQMRCMWETKMGFIDDQLRFSAARAADTLGQGIGQIARPTDIRGVPEWELTPFRSLEDGARLVNQIQRFLMEETRLGIPALMHDELAHGLLAGDATIFPSPPALGSTWNPSLVEEVFTVAAREAR